MIFHFLVRFVFLVIFFSCSDLNMQQTDTDLILHSKTQDLDQDLAPYTVRKSAFNKCLLQVGTYFVPLRYYLLQIIWATTCTFPCKRYILRLYKSMVQPQNKQNVQFGTFLSEHVKVSSCCPSRETLIDFCFI